jgi:CRP-like cAMP-binding protein
VLIAILAAEVRRLSQHLVEALYVSADKRVLRRLVEMTAIFGHGDSAAVVPLTQEDLAGLAGTSRATVNRVLREEEARGTLELGRGRTTVLNADELARRGR